LDRRDFVFVVSLSYFNEPCYEDYQTRRLDDSLSCFETLINMESLSTEQNWYLLFNKANILEKISKDIKFSDYYPTFSG